MEERKYIVYKITNKINGKIYIGQFAQKSGFNNYMGSGVAIKRAQKKYSIENFEKEIIEYCVNKEQLDEREIYWIEYYNSTNRNIGYNITKGGGGTLGLISHNKGKKGLYKASEETKKKMSNSRKGRKITEETRKKLRGKKRTEEQKKRMSISFKYRKVSEETRKKFSNIHKNKIVSDEVKQKLSRKVIIDGVEYKSLSYAAQQLNLKENNLRHRMNSKNFPNYFFKNEINNKRGLPKKITIDDIQYYSIAEASRQLNINASTIRIRLNSSFFPNYQYAE